MCSALIVLHAFSFYVTLSKSFCFVLIYHFLVAFHVVALILRVFKRTNLTPDATPYFLIFI